MEFRGLTQVDSLYEYAGFRLAQELADVAWGVALPVILGLAGLAYVVHASLQKESLRDALIHVFYLMAMAWLLGTTQVSVAAGANTIRGQLHLAERPQDGIRVPRFVAYLDSGADHLQRRAIEKIDARFLNAPFEKERMAAILDAADIFDGVIKDDLCAFRLYCYRPAVAIDPRSNAELVKLYPLAPGAFQYRGLGRTTVSDENKDKGHIRYTLDCEDARGWLEVRVNEHLEEPVHKKAIAFVAELLTGRSYSTDVTAEYRKRVVQRAMINGPMAPGGGGESMIIRAALPSESEADRAARVRVMEDRGGGRAINDGLDLLVGATGRFKQTVTNSYTTKQQLYLAVLHGPYLYGIVLMIVIGLFPVVGLFALLPGRWRALVNYGKVLFSIKLWPVCWAVLSRFTARAPSFDTFGDGVGTGEFVTVVASMYLLTPLLCLAIVNLVTSVSSIPFQQAVPAPAGSAVGGAVAAARMVVVRR